MRITGGARRVWLRTRLGRLSLYGGWRWGGGAYWEAFLALLYFTFRYSLGPERADNAR